MNTVSNIEELEEALDELLPGGFSIETNSRGEVVIYTGLQQDEDGELTPMDVEEDEDFNPDTDSLEDDDLDDEE
jgi:hypothetical protein